MTVKGRGEQREALLQRCTKVAGKASAKNTSCSIAKSPPPRTSARGSACWKPSFVQSGDGMANCASAGIDADQSLTRSFFKSRELLLCNMSRMRLSVATSKSVAVRDGTLLPMATKRGIS